MVIYPLNYRLTVNFILRDARHVPKCSRNLMLLWHYILVKHCEKLIPDVVIVQFLLWAG